MSDVLRIVLLFAVMILSLLAISRVKPPCDHPKPHHWTRRQRRAVRRAARRDFR